MYWVSAQALTTSTSVLSEIHKEEAGHNISDQPSANKISTVKTTLKEAPAFEDAHSVSLYEKSKLTETAIAPSKTITPPGLPNSSDQLIQVTLALALVVGLIYGVAWLIKRNKGFSPTSGIPMKTLSVLPMGVKEKIILIEVGGKQILLGMTPSNINTLATFDEPIIDASLQNDKPFSTRLKDMLNQAKNPESNE